MNKVKTKCEVKVYELNGGDKFATVGSEVLRVHVDSHWNLGDMVVLSIYGHDEVCSSKVTVLGMDLLNAVNKAMN